MSATPPNGSLPVVRLVFWVAALYDGILGAAFLLFAPTIVQWAALPAPGHYGYLRFAGALVLIFALMFLDVALNPRRNRNLMAYGALLKIAFCALAFYYWTRGSLPMLYKYLGIIDGVFLVLFLCCYVGLRPRLAAVPPCCAEPASAQR